MGALHTQSTMLTANTLPDLRCEAVSSGTPRPEDLLQSFTDVLGHLAGDSEAVREGERLCRIIAESDDGDTLPDHLVEEASWASEGLFEGLGELSPDGFYFGGHEGDGALFGWWPAEDF